MKKISCFISDLLYANDVLAKDDIESCRYGLELLMASILELSSIFIISIFIGNILETMLFFLAFIPLRIYAGGYHADTKLRCYLISLITYGVFSLILFTIPGEFYNGINVCSVIITYIMVYKYAPIIHKNKNASILEIKYYRRFSLLIMFGMTVIIILFALFLDSKMTLCYSLGELTVSISMFMALVKNNFEKIKNKYL